MQILWLVLALALALASAPARADIYGYVDAQGVAHLATEKVDARYKLFSRGDALLSSPSLAIGEGRPELLRYLARHPNLKKFGPFLKAAADEFAVDSALIKAVMAAESGFNPDAISARGAIGLMQVMPATAERYGLRGDKRKSLEEKLSEPETNIRLGARYLRDLQRMFPDQQDLVLASYNAGEGAVQQYNNRIPPYPETRNYVQLVTQIYQLYRPRALTRSLQSGIVANARSKGTRLHLTIPGQGNRPSAADAGSD
ncbi:MAG: transglycosylase SLT domain-containing protein [Candidatus Accumulibacter sp.]|uniref:lytic transglycosylase domain-containing protein n=1 Tax=Accumulibacter sp. TaxID=2053492 RepID=UPI001D3D8749|nr:lytic transglycosylase domain-containing protein [Accumulibacter sp.]MCB1940977.1 transglycosylase SLT domain-containing protein [Accumulibacter sp.]MCP5249973.1 transglycosylase SLT domain-containing protein [Accumulibacter sp.]